MAKDTAEDKTVPIYNPDGSLAGYTTPEKYASLDDNQRFQDALKDSFGGSGAPEFDYSTGFSDDNDYVKVFNPLTNDFDVVPTGGDWKAWNPAGDNTNWVYHPEHGRVLMRTDVEGWEDTGAKQFDPDGIDGGWLWGAEEQVITPNPDRELSLGDNPNDDGTYGPQPPPPTTTQPPGTAPPYTPPPAPPGVDEPTDDWNPIDWDDYIGYENVPVPDGDGSFQEGGPPPDTSWDWSFFRDRAPGDRQWGGYDEDYQAFERYIPGMESPWGLPNVKGGNKDFYQQQFLNQLRDEQGYQNRERAAQMRRQEALNAEPQDISSGDMWSWAYGGQGLPEVKMGGGAPQMSWELNQAFTPNESTIGDILTWASTNEGLGQGQGFYKTILDSITDEGRASTAWSRHAGDPSALRDRLTDWGGLDRKQQGYMSNLVDALYNPGAQGPYAPANYASPVQWGNAYPATGG